MEYTFAQYQESAQALRDRLGAFRPRCLLILGSGLGSLGNEVESPIAVPYEDVPHMKRSTAPDHAGRFVFGRLAGQDVAVMQGRLHTYEGWSFEDVSYPVRVLRLLGARVRELGESLAAMEQLRQALELARAHQERRIEKGAVIIERPDITINLEGAGENITVSLDEDPLAP